MKTALKSLLLIGLAGGIAAGALAREQPNPSLQALDDQLPGDLINDPSGLDWAVSGQDISSSKIRDSAIPGGGAAVDVKIAKKGQNPWDSQASAPLLTGIEKGQIVTVGFYARTIKADTRDGKGIVTVRVQQNASPYSGFIEKSLPVGPEWAFYEASGKANRAMAKGEAVVTLHLAEAQQELQLGQLIVVANAESIIPDKPAGPADETASLPAGLQGKGDLIADAGKRTTWAFYGDGLTHEAGTQKVLGVTSIHATTAAKAEHPHDMAVTIPIDGAIKTGDPLIVSIAVRTNASDTPDGTGLVGVRVMQNAEPWPGFGDGQLSFAAGKWQLITMQTQATLDIPAGQGAVQLQLGGAKQDLDIGPVFILKAKAEP